MSEANSSIPAAAKQRVPSTFAALRHPNYRLWFFGQTVSLMGTWMQSVAQGWVVYELTGSKMALGTIAFLGSIPTLFLMLPAGALADRIPKRRVLYFTQAAMMLLAFTLALLTATKVLRVWHIGVLASLLGVVNSFDAPARQALAVEMVDDRRDLPNAIAMNSMMFNIARILGPAIAGVILAAFGSAWCFALNGLSFLAVLFALWRMRLPNVVRSSHNEKLSEQVLSGLRYIRDNSAVRTIIAVVGVASLFSMSYATLLPAFAADVLKVGESGLGELNAAVGVGALVGALTLASLGGFRNKGLLLSAGNVLLPLGVVGFAFSRSFALSCAFLILTGWAVVTQNATSNTLVQLIVPDDLRGRVMSAYMVVFFGSAPFAALQAGAIAQAWGPTAGVAVGAVISLVFALVVLCTVPTLRRLTDAPPARAESIH